MSSQIETLVTGLLAGHRPALAQALSLAEQGGPTYAKLRKHISAAVTAKAVLGVTGPPGAGKSSLVNAVIREWRLRDNRIAVIAVDPSSPLSGGALLGDRLRMDAALDDTGVFVRSLSSGGSAGGLAPAVVRLIDIFDAAGFDRILVETVGAGQSEIDIAAVADVKIVVSAPGLGDGIQAIKSGLLEIADCLVVNKSDLRGADATAEQLRNAVSLRGTETSMVPVMLTSAIRQRGITELVDFAEEELGARDLENPNARLRRRATYLIERVAVEMLRARLQTGGDAGTVDAIDALISGDVTTDEAARTLIEATLAATE